MAFGAWVGLVVGVKLIHLSIRRRRAEYEPDPANCVSCGRCFWYCPQEQARLGARDWIGIGQGIPTAVARSPATSQKVDTEFSYADNARLPERATQTTGYRIAARTAWVAGVFSVVVCALLLADYARRRARTRWTRRGSSNSRPSWPSSPRDEALKDEIRALDLALREEYFRQRAFTHVGGHLLLGGVRRVARRRPNGGHVAAEAARCPSRAATPTDAETRTDRIARASVAALAVVLAATAIGVDALVAE